MDKKTEQLCPKCKTGRDSLKLDPKEPFCPFLHLHSKEGCKGFVSLVGGDEK